MAALFRIPWVLMGRMPAVPGGRRIVVSTRLSEAESAELDVLRGSIDAATYLRLLIHAAVRLKGV